MSDDTSVHHIAGQDWTIEYAPLEAHSDWQIKATSGKLYPVRWYLFTAGGEPFHSIYASPVGGRGMLMFDTEQQARDAVAQLPESVVRQYAVDVEVTITDTIYVDATGPYAAVTELSNTESWRHALRFHGDDSPLRAVSHIRRPNVSVKGVRPVE